MERPEVRIEKSRVWVTMADGRSGSMPLDAWPRLASASAESLADFYLSDDGVHWPSLDEDITYECILSGGERRTGLYALFMELDFINVSALARRLRISQSLMAQYVSGSKRPSPSRLRCIEAELHRLAAEMAAVRLT